MGVEELGRTSIGELNHGKQDAGSKTKSKAQRTRLNSITGTNTRSNTNTKHTWNLVILI